jgi:2'-5' RNA ligase
MVGMQRVFIGVKVSPLLQAEVIAWQDEHRSLDVNWIPPEDLHMTLVPPWEEDDIDDVLDRMERAAKTLRPFELTFQRVSSGPTAFSPWLLWATAEKTRACAELYERFRAAFAVEDHRPFTPHVTVARFERGAVSTELSEAINWKETATNVTLFTSPGGGTGYVMLGEYRFK